MNHLSGKYHILMKNMNPIYPSVLKSDEELKPYLYLLFEWLQDLNWPGAYVIFERLLKMPYALLESELNYCKKRAEKENDELWLMALEDFNKQINL